MNFYIEKYWKGQVGALESSKVATTEGNTPISPNPTFRWETCRNVPEQEDLGTVGLVRLANVYL